MGILNDENFYKQLPTISNKRNRFPFVKEINFNMKMGEITPIAVIRVVPGQTYNLDMSTVLKVAPMVVPPQDSAIFKCFAFYNPDRNTWKNYKYWLGEKQKPESPEEEPTYIMPKVTMPENGFAFNSFYDNIGCPPEKGGYKINATLPRSDRQIYNTYFRNQTLENPLDVNLGDEDDDPMQNMELRKICKPRDFFTQCLPTQSGTTPVEIPLGSEVPVTVDVYGNGGILGMIALPGGTYGHFRTTSNSQDSQTNAFFETAVPDNSPLGVTKDRKRSGLIGTGIADLSKAMGAPLEGLYQAVAYNTYQYLLSRGGSRYFEYISSIYGVANPDGVIQIPEYLGSSQSVISFDTVVQTSSTNGENTPLGNRAANGYCNNYGRLVNKSFGEFGYIFIYGVITYHPKYQQGVSKLLQEDDPIELFNPIFNLMGDEAIYESEIYVQSDKVVDENNEPINNRVWGYGKRNSRLLYPVNEVHGEQRSSYAQSLDTNHFAQYFESAPVLNKSFDKVTDEGFKRALMVTDETQFVGNALITGTNDIQIPLASTPSIVPPINGMTA